MSRVGTRSRSTKETTVEVRIDLDGAGRVEAATGIPYFDHMLDQLGRHGGFDLVAKTVGDLAVDTHHTIEDTGIAIGQALAEALGDKAGVRRFASIRVPLDEALVEVVIDLSGRPYLHYEVEFPEHEIIYGQPPFDAQLTEEFFRAVVVAAGITLHVTRVRGKNTHHIVEASFKGVARALRDAVRVEGTGVPSTKGTL
ncbi:MAG: imidazoleglycerol-phosphate dehydratase [Acidimicrobiia bacterium]|jgi:imidazoleglycerol-phosphate dehydratase|nr:imidazoleglycerol-phosphate dehydratase [Acidimicrobiia bacterium]